MTKIEREKRYARNDQILRAAESEWMSSYNQANPISLDQFMKNRGIKVLQRRIGREERAFRAQCHIENAARRAKLEAEYLEETGQI